MPTIQASPITMPLQPCPYNRPSHPRTPQPTHQLCTKSHHNIKPTMCFSQAESDPQNPRNPRNPRNPQTPRSPRNPRAPQNPQDPQRSRRPPSAPDPPGPRSSTPNRSRSRSIRPRRTSAPAPSPPPTTATKSPERKGKERADSRDLRSKKSEGDDSYDREGVKEHRHAERERNRDEDGERGRQREREWDTVEETLVQRHIDLYRDRGESRDRERSGARKAAHVGVKDFQQVDRPPRSGPPRIGDPDKARRRFQAQSLDEDYDEYYL